MTAPQPRKPMTLHRLREMHRAGEPLAMLTCYDASFARLMDQAGVDILLVGDSLGMTVQGHHTTVPVSMDDMVYHTAAVARGNQHAWVIGDMPFGSYQEGPEQAMRHAARLMAAGAHMVKLEGGGWTTDTVRFLTDRGVPVCAHLGLTPQIVHALGGYRIQGRTDEAVAVLKAHALALQAAGASMLVLELVTSRVGQELTQALDIPTIGIGAGSACSGQVLVMHDMLGITQGKLPRFVRNFQEGQPSVLGAVQAYVQAVKARTFPVDEQHGYAS